MMKEIQAPQSFAKEQGIAHIFLAGSIEMGKADHWQKRVAEELKDSNVVLLNPRRDDWDSSWKQTIDDPQFNEQVTWELKSLERADYILMYIDPNTKSPITLLELGLYAQEWRKLWVCCPEGFYRKGNVDIVCNLYGIMQVETLEDLIAAAKKMEYTL